MTRLLIPLAILAGLAALYIFVIRPRGAHMLATYRAARAEGANRWAAVKAVLWGYQTLWTAVGGAIVMALPEVLTVLSGIDFNALLPEPWGVYVGTGVAIANVLLRSIAATPTGEPPSGEA